jgi:hypothetical protein
VIERSRYIREGERILYNRPVGGWDSTRAVGFSAKKKKKE